MISERPGGRCKGIFKVFPSCLGRSSPVRGWLVPVLLRCPVLTTADFLSQIATAATGCAGSCWARGAWRDKPAPLGVLFALSLQPWWSGPCLLFAMGQSCCLLSRGVCVPLWPHEQQQQVLNAFELSGLDESPDNFFSQKERWGDNLLNVQIFI